MIESFAELFEQSQIHLTKLKPGSIVMGTVVAVSYTHLDVYKRQPDQ